MPGMGLSYQPGVDTVPMQGGGMGASPSTPAESPAKVLSLRLPKNLGQSPIAARDLLMAPGAGGSPGLNAIIQQLMRSYSGGGQPSSEQPQSQSMTDIGRLAAMGGIRPDQINVGASAPIPRVFLGNEPGLNDRGAGEWNGLPQGWGPTGNFGQMPLADGSYTQGWLPNGTNTMVPSYLNADYLDRSGNSLF